MGIKFLINNVNIKECSLEKINLYKKDINYLLVYKYMLQYFNLVSSKNDIMMYYTYGERPYVLNNNNFLYYCKENDFGLENTMLKSYIIRDIKIKNIIND